MNKIEVTIEDLQITITPNNINIKDSYTIKDPFEMRVILKEIKEFLKENNITMDTPFNHRSLWSMIREWVSHNNAYVIGYKRKRVGSVDLTPPQKWYAKVLYFILSMFVL